MCLFERVGNLFAEKAVTDSNLESLHADHSNPARTVAVVIAKYDQSAGEWVWFDSHGTQRVNRHSRNVPQKWQSPTEAETISRLTFIRYFLREGQSFLDYEHAKEIWVALVLGATDQSEKDIRFEWFTTLMGDDPDLKPEAIYRFFIENILQYNTAQLNQASFFVSPVSSRK